MENYLKTKHTVEHDAMEFQMSLQKLFANREWVRVWASIGSLSQGPIIWASFLL